MKIIKGFTRFASKKQEDKVREIINDGYETLYSIMGKTFVMMNPMSCQCACIDPMGRIVKTTKQSLVDREIILNT